MHRCPHCHSPLPGTAVLRAGTLNPQKCPHCGEPYVGGLPAFMAAFSVTAYGALLLLFKSGSAAAMWALLAAGLAVSLWLMFRAQPIPASCRYRNLALSIAPIILLMLAFKLTAAFPAVAFL
jgi:hypothetical protein